MSAKHGVLCPRPTMKWLLALGSLAAHTTLVGAVSTWTKIGSDLTFVALYDLTILSDPLITADNSRDNFLYTYKLSDATNSASSGSQTFAATVDLASSGCDAPDANKAYRVVTTTADGTQTVSDQVNLVGDELGVATLTVVSDPSLDGTQKTVEVEFDCGVGFASIQANGVELLSCAEGSAGIPCTACAGTEYASGVLGSECAETTTFVLRDLLDSQGGRQALSAAWAASGECDAV